MQQADKFVIRLPEGMRDRIRQNAEANRRTMNAEILHYIDKAIAPLRNIVESAFDANGVQKGIAATGSKFGDQSPAAAEDHNTQEECCDAANT